MNLTVKDVVHLYQDQSVRLVAGEGGMHKAVSSVNIMDAPDIWNWVKPGELVLTTAFAIKDDSVLQEKLIRELAAAGSAGLAIKTKRFLSHIPPIMCEAANELNFPIIELPLSLSLAEIMNPIVSSIAARHSYRLHRSNEIHKALTNEAVQGGGLPQIIACLGTLSQCPVGIYNSNGMPISSWLPPHIPDVDQDLLSKIENFLNSPIDDKNEIHQNLAQMKSPHTSKLTIHNRSFLLTSSAIVSSNDFFGHISILQPTDAFLDINAAGLEHACTVAALDFIKRKAINESRRLRSRDILEHILFGDLNNQATIEITVASKLAQAKHFQCLIVSVDQNPSEVNLPIIINNLYKAASKYLSNRYPLSIISERAGQLIILLAASLPFYPLEELYAKLTQDITKNVPVSIGAGTLAVDIQSVRLSYDSSLIALNLGRAIKGTGCITYPHEIASYYILDNTPAANILERVYAPIVERLKVFDRNHGADLLKTLEVYLEWDMNASDSAKELYVHRNTLNNRLEKIIDLTNLTFDDRELIFSLRLHFRREKLKTATSLPALVKHQLSRQ